MIFLIGVALYTFAIQKKEFGKCCQVSLSGSNHIGSLYHLVMELFIKMSAIRLSSSNYFRLEVAKCFSYLALAVAVATYCCI